MMKAFVLIPLVLCLAQVAQARLEDNCDLKPESLSSLKIFSEEILQRTKSHPGVLTREAGIYGTDDRTIPNTEISPWRSIGRLRSRYPQVTMTGIDGPVEIYSESESNCTATLVSGCHLITAKHCVNDVYREPPDNTPSKMTFEDSKGRSITAKKFLSGPKNADASHDWAVIQLDGSPGNDLGYTSVCKRRPDEIKNNSNIVTAGFSMDFEDAQSLGVDPSSVKRGKSKGKKDVIYMAADSYLGASGGPVFVMDENDEPCVAGVQSEVWLSQFQDDDSMPHQMYFDDDEKEQLATATATSAFFDEMVKFMKDNPCE